jgi:hypothetical protein
MVIFNRRDVPTHEGKYPYTCGLDLTKETCQYVNRTRRQFIKTIGATGAATLLPFRGASTLAGLNKSVGPLDGTYISSKLWENHHQTIAFKPQRYYDIWNRWNNSSSPERRRWRAGLDIIRQLVRDAERHGCQIRALGGGWSLSNAVETRGFLVNTKPLNVVEIGVHPENCAPEFLRCDPGNSEGTKADRLVFAQCGASIAELSALLETRGLSLPTSGASNGQTICGAVSTGTHGGAARFGSIQDFVVGIHIVSEGGKECWLQRKSNPVINQRFCDILDPKTSLIEDDRLFNAALVSFGSFGIIHALLLQAEPLFLLRRRIRTNSYKDVLPRLGSLSGLDELGCEPCLGRPFHYEVLINPYDLHSQHGTLFRHMYKLKPPDPCKVDFVDDQPLEKRRRSSETLSNDAFGLVGKIVGIVPLAVPLAVNAIFKSQTESDDGTTLTHGETFDSTHIPGNSVSSELGLDLKHVSEATEIIVEEMRRSMFPGILSLRYVKASPALLAFTKFEEVTCTAEIVGVRTFSSLKSYRRIWEKLENARNPILFTYHWGQLQRWGENPAASRERISQVFGSRLDDWLNARRKFLPNAGRYTFSGPLLEDCGLSEVH